MTIQISRRRIQRLGGSSLIVTLPKTWIRKYGLSAGDEVLVVDEGTHLRILPSFPGAEAKLKTLTLDKIHMNSVNLENIAECAFAKGYDRVEVPVRTSHIEELLAQLERVERTDYVKSIDMTGTSVLINLIDSRNSPSLILKYVRKTVIEILESLANGPVDPETVRDILASLKTSMREFQRIMSKKGVSACEEAPVDPFTLGVFISAITAFEHVVRLLAERGQEQRKTIVDMLIPILVSGLGGLLNGSVKRTNEAREMISEARIRLRHMKEKDPGLQVVEMFLDVLDSLFENTLCNIIGKNSR